jgi:hypothetical protein
MQAVDSGATPHSSGWCVTAPPPLELRVLGVLGCCWGVASAHFPSSLISLTHSSALSDSLARAEVIRRRLERIHQTAAEIIATAKQSRAHSTSHQPRKAPGSKGGARSAGRAGGGQRGEGPRTGAPQLRKSAQLLNGLLQRKIQVRQPLHVLRRARALYRGETIEQRKATRRINSRSRTHSDTHPRQHQPARRSF